MRSSFHSVNVVLSVALGALVLACGGNAPRGRHRVWNVEIQGLQAIDPAAVEACLGTREIPRVAVDLGSSTDLVCGEPPFDGARIHLPLWAWTWNAPPLFDENVLARDGQRIERFLRARGYYDGHIVTRSVEPEVVLADNSALEPATDLPEDRDCAHGGSCDVTARFTVQEGEPVRVQRVEIRGEDEVTPALRAQLRSVLEVHRGEVFDEADFRATEHAMARLLANTGHPRALVRSEAKIDRARHEAYLAFEVTPGPLGVVGRVCVTGYGSLPAETIYYATFLQPGREFSVQAIEEAQQAVYALGTIAAVEIRPHNAEVAVADSAVDDSETTTLTTNTIATETLPEATVDANEEAQEQQPSAAHEIPYCTESPQVEAGIEVVDLDVRIRPGRNEHLDIGVFGIQSGDSLTLGSASQQQGTGGLILSQWDLHLSALYEHRNLADRMLRFRFEVRPRLIFPRPFPGGVIGDFAGKPGAQVNMDLRWPGFVEPRTSAFFGVTYDYGIAPLLNFFRHELSGRLGVERTFFDGKLFSSLALRGNFFQPEGIQGVRVLSERETTSSIFLEQILTLDLRDNSRQPHDGFFAALGLQEGGLSSWDYFRFTAEVRGYVPLPFGLVLAGRFGMGGLFVFATNLEHDNIYQLAELGSFSQQLTGGGPNGNRGFAAGYEGDIERRYVRSRPLPEPGRSNFGSEIFVSGGTRKWDASLELRIPISSDIGFVVFLDAGDVTRASGWRFNLPQVSVGGGLRYRTAVGPIRLDLGFRPDALQYFGQDTRPPECSAATVYENCRPRSDVFGDFGARSVPGAIHISIGESF